MNLDQITTKCWILALFERDDGERLLLGDGWFDFKDSLQHFQPNTFANDVIELQGSDGQMLAGQVRRGAPQSFDGYIGDPITNRQTIEQHRREFLMFFRKRHHYKVVYIFPDGTAIQRKQGYITDAPSVPEIRQKFPEYHVALNFEDVNYYEYAENAQGEEIFSNIRDINISTAATGGLVWDNLGDVSDQMGWKDIATATGQMLTMTNPESIKAPIASFEMTGNATQSGTPTPSAPVPVETVTGRQTVGVVGKNLFDKDNVEILHAYTGGSGTIANERAWSIILKCEPSTEYTYSNANSTAMLGDSNVSFYTTKPVVGSAYISRMTIGQGATSTFTAPSTAEYMLIYYHWGGDDGASAYEQIQIEKGNQATAYEPYEERSYEINLGKNLFDKDNPNVVRGYIAGTNLTSGTDYTIYIPCEESTTYTIQKMVAVPQTANRFRVNSYATEPTGGSTSISSSYFWNAGDGSATTTHTYTTPTGAKYLGITVMTANTSGTTTADDMYASIQIEKGSIASPYSPHFEPIELCKIGTYQDRIYKENGKWWLHKEVGKVVLDGTEAWTYNGDDGSTSQFRLPTSIGAIATGENSINAFVSHFSGNVNGSTATAPCFWFNQQGLLRLRVYQSTASNLSGFKTWLASNPTTVYYPLATATDTEITDEAVLEGLHSAAGLKLFPGQNNIMDQTPDAQPTMTVQYYTALGPGGGLVWESGEAGGATIIEASGLDSAFPLWTVPGPSTNPTLTNITTGQSIAWQGTVPAGQTLEIDMDKQTATLAGANVYAFVSGDWIRIDPGPNRMTYVGTGATQASTLSWNNIVG